MEWNVHTSKLGCVCVPGESSIWKRGVAAGSPQTPQMFPVAIYPRVRCAHLDTPI